MSAFALAVSAGATYVETDVHATRDGIAVISHDPDLTRLTGRDQRLLDLDLSDVRAVRLDGEHEIPTLDEALDAFPETRFNIDLKSDEAVAPAVRAIARVRATDRVLITSFDHRRRRRAVRALPGVATSASSRGIAAAMAAGLVPFPRLRRSLVRRALVGCGAVQVPERKGPVRIVTSARVAEWAALGVETHVWTVNDPTDMARLLAVGVHGIVTDRADLALEEVRRHIG
ncbi:glycerophosphodiester phosphodiesterase family protein [Frigoribacterium sp. VKM Ac-2836]|uniref:glycerophosphodiester phosphodiesterase family protein n=1 Tax=Frigoribacterium sp. VKM Ac-2836 TaxID=2739014 RepID=UPI00156451A0|nr:glycerophosphodiester phosphodiesterase family protein [Frigoribacterium sp. VKM Ac-2836]NRD26087.1 glycerophosphodiester phosphodiesterase [Frigoribacterium sp. VKM Ac-2836]